MGEHSSISLARVVKKLLCSKAPGMDEICPEMLKALDIVGLSYLTCLVSVEWRSETVPLAQQTRVMVPILKKGGVGKCVSIIRVLHCSAYLGKFIPGCQKGCFSQLLNLRFRRIKADSALVVEHWSNV